MTEKEVIDEAGAMNTSAVTDLLERIAELRRQNIDLHTRNAELATVEELSWEKDLQIRHLQEAETATQLEMREIVCQSTELQNILNDNATTIANLQRSIVDFKMGQHDLQQQADQRYTELAREKDRDLQKLRATETELRLDFLATSSELEQTNRRLIETTQSLSHFRNAFETQTAQVQTIKDDAQRAVAKIADLNWEKDLEIERLCNLELDLNQRIKHFEIECASLRKFSQESAERLECLQTSFGSCQMELQMTKRLHEREIDELGRAQQKSRLLYNRNVRELTHDQALERHALRGTEFKLSSDVKSLRGECAMHVQELQKSKTKIEHLEESLKAANTQQVMIDQQTLIDLRTQLEEAARRREDSVQREQSLGAEIVKLVEESQRKDHLLKSSNEICGRLESQIAAHEQMIEQLEAKNLSQQDSTNTEIAALRSAYEAETAKLKMAQELVEEVRAAFKTSRAEHLLDQQTLNTLQAELKETTLRIEQFTAIEQSLRTETANLVEESKGKDHLLKSANQICGRLEWQIAAHEKMIEQLETKNLNQQESMNAEMAALRGAYDAETAKLQMAQELVEEVRAAFKASRAEHLLDQQTLNSLHAQLKDTTLRIEQFAAIEQSLRAETAKLLEEAKGKDHLLKSVNEICGRLDAQTAEHKKTIGQLEVRNLNQQKSLDEALKTVSELTHLQQAINANTSNRVAEEREFRTWASALDQREQQLCNYMSHLSKEKAAVLKFSKIIAGEIQMIMAAHPLKDFLAATEYELSNVELRLKTTPILSPERRALEICLKQIIEQRDFLKTVITKSQNQFEGQAETLLNLVQSGKLGPVPPPPPRPRRAADNAPITDISVSAVPPIKWQNLDHELT